ncbi:cell wall hydrolase [uncultured Pseudomonas sp.]|uniref:cell wall hydrolase n=1 Tax=uncultured Pseudomonas sp. TaxID=114707 RepID=UPI0025EF08D7|nr:cell wall hydrolase [uncultured Pseudomonas sp.]
MPEITEDIDVVARTLFGEARGESLKGQQAVCWTIRNRVEARTAAGKSLWWGDSYPGVCRKKYQFSCWLPSDPNYPFLIGQRAIPAATYKSLCEVARQVISGEVKDPTGGATHYYATSIKAPAWTVGAKFTVQIGNHRFYRDVP